LETGLFLAENSDRKILSQKCRPELLPFWAESELFPQETNEGILTPLLLGHSRTSRSKHMRELDHHFRPRSRSKAKPSGWLEAVAFLFPIRTINAAKKRITFGEREIFRPPGKFYDSKKTPSGRSRR
jgi:hypothetical protein